MEQRVGIPISLWYTAKERQPMHRNHNGTTLIVVNVGKEPRVGMRKVVD